MSDGSYWFKVGRIGLEALLVSHTLTVVEGSFAVFCLAEIASDPREVRTESDCNPSGFVNLQDQSEDYTYNTLVKNMYIMAVFTSNFQISAALIVVGWNEWNKNYFVTKTFMKSTTVCGMLTFISLVYVPIQLGDMYREQNRSARRGGYVATLALNQIVSLLLYAKQYEVHQQNNLMHNLTNIM